jgi:hypothetical protein
MPEVKNGKIIMAKKSKLRSKEDRNIHQLGTALDLMLAGHRTVIGADFLMTIHDPFNAEIGHLDPEDLRNFDQSFVNAFIHLKPNQEAVIPKDLSKLYQEYREQRENLCDYQKAADKYLFKEDIAAAEELGNFDVYLDKIVLRNEAEINVFYDYLALYRKQKNNRSIVHWQLNNPTSVTKQNRAVVTAYEKAKFALLRLDKNFAHGAIKVTNMITKNQCILMDRALNESQKEGCFFICSILDMGNYVMTSGGGITVDTISSRSKSILTLFKKHLEKLQSSKRVLNKDIAKCVQEIYGFCLRSGALKYMTIK